jgi:hypothetical protein
MYSNEELAQPVGNAKIRGEFDTDAATAVDPNTNEAVLFQRLIDLNSALGREETLSLPARGIAQLPPGSNKVLAVVPMASGEDTPALTEPVSGCLSQETDLVLFPSANPCLRSDRDGKMSGSSLAGTVLARRYKILERIDGDSFKAHDLALDQTVTVRQATRAWHHDGETWGQKVQQLASVRDPNFLNILDVIFDKSNNFVITERPRGHSIGDLLRERSHFELEDVLRIMTPLVGALDLAVGLTCCPNPISARWLFTESRRSFAVNPQERSLSELSPFFVKLDVWELVKPRKDTAQSFLNSKAQTGSSKRMAVRQVALLTYELLGGETREETQAKRWFKPVNELGKAGNSILYHGLQGSRRFKTSESFFHKLESAIRSGTRESRERHVPARHTREHSMTSLGANDVLRRFNRDTAWLAVCLLSVVFFAALAFAILIPEPRPATARLQGRANQAKSAPSLTTDAAELFKIVDSSAERSPSQVTSVTLTHVDQGSTESCSKERPTPVEVAEKATPAPDLVFPGPTPSIETANVSKWSPAQRKESAQAIRGKAPYRSGKSSQRLGDVDVKKRLIELWHQSLVRAEKPRSWEMVSKLDRRKKAAFTARKQP